MSLSDSMRARLDELVKQHDFVLFMKGSRGAPQCGFSAAVVDALDEWLDDYATVNVLADPDVRDAIKHYSEWPTIPQLYVRGEFVGGGDIVREMARTGELGAVTGTSRKTFSPPSMEVTAAAQEAFLGAVPAGGADHIHFRIGPRGMFDLSLGPKQDGDVEVQCGRVLLLLDPASARKANGLRIDFADGPQGRGFKIENPAAPSVRQLRVEELKAAIDAGEQPWVFDVRGENERAVAKLPFAQALDPAAEARIAAAPKDTPLVFHCHHGGRSQRAAEHFLGQGYTRVSNLVGGIDRWSITIDTTVPRY